MSEPLPIREYTAFKFKAAPEACKCGKCHLVPPEVIRDAAAEIDILQTAFDRLEGLFKQAVEQRDAATALVHEIRAMTLSEAAAYAGMLGKTHNIKDACGDLTPQALHAAKATAARIANGIRQIPGAALSPAPSEARS